MAANYGRPKPVDPLFWLHGRYLRAVCACGHNLSMEVSTFAALAGLPKNMLAHQLIDRLKCSKCGQRPKRAWVAEREMG